MEFFGITSYGPQNYIKDMMRPDYEEPTKKEDVGPLMIRVQENSTCPKNRPNVETIRLIDVYIGRVNGFAYGSLQRFEKIKRKGVIKPPGPMDIFRLPITTQMEYGWMLCDPTLENKKWYVTSPRYPIPISPNTRILDIVRKNDRYATLF